MATIGGMRARIGSRFGVLGVAALVAACSSPTAIPSVQPTGGSSAQPLPSTSASAAPSGPPTVPLADITTFDITAEKAPDWPVLLDESLWVLVPDGDDPAVLRLDPANGDQQARISLPGGGCEMLTAGFGAIWACTPDGLVRIDPATNAIATSISFQTPQQFGRPAMSEDAIWWLSGAIVATQVVRIDPALNTVVATYPLGHSVGQIAYGLGYVWATATQDGLLLRIDPSNGTVETVATDLVDPFMVAAGGDRVWVGLQGQATNEDPPESVPDLFRYDPATETGDSFDYGVRPESVNEIAVDDTDVWLKAVSPFLARIDPDSGEIEWVVDSDRGSGALVVADGILWMTLWRAQAVLRIDL